jgi:hypothetical protein
LRSQLNGSYDANSGPPRGGHCKDAIRPMEASKAAVCYVRNTSKPVKLIGFSLERRLVILRNEAGGFPYRACESAAVTHSDARATQVLAAMRSHSLARFLLRPISLR